MRRGRLTRVGVAVALFALLASSASAANPGQIYRDYADNGRIDGTYSGADYRAALTDASVQGYGNPTVTVGFKGAVASRIAPTRPAGTLGVAAVRSTLPFTGIDLALLVAGGAGLLLLGAVLRRLGPKRG
jgi:opacity protein-like surface antigen